VDVGVPASLQVSQVTISVLLRQTNTTLYQKVLAWNAMNSVRGYDIIMGGFGGFGSAATLKSPPSVYDRALSASEVACPLRPDTTRLPGHAAAVLDGPLVRGVGGWRGRHRCGIDHP
jgi:hypothetical protein